MRTTQHLVSHNQRYQVYATSPLKDKLKCIESKTHILQELTFMLFHFIEPVYNQEVLQKNRTLELLTTSCIERYQELAKYRADIPLSGDFVQLARTISTTDLSAYLFDPVRTKELKKLAILTNTVEHLKNFNLQEERMYKVIDNKCSFFEIFMIFQSLSYIASLLDFNTKKLPQRLTTKLFTLNTFFHMFMCVQDVFYGLCRPMVLTLTKKLVRTPGLSYSLLKIDNFMAYSIDCGDFDTLVGLCADELEYEEYTLIESIVNTRLEQDKILIGYNENFDERYLIEYFDKIVESMYKNLWVEQKVRRDVSEITTTTKKDRKQLSKTIATKYALYLAQFDKSIMYPCPEEEEDSDENEEGVESQEDGGDTPEETEIIKEYLSKKEYIKYSNHTPQSRKQDVNQILKYIIEHRELLKENLCRLTYIMKFSDVLPDLDNQCTTMRFGKIYFSNCLKINITRGDRLVLYFDNFESLSIKFLTLQEYHKLRSA